MSSDPKVSVGGQALVTWRVEAKRGRAPVGPETVALMSQVVPDNWAPTSDAGKAGNLECLLNALHGSCVFKGRGSSNIGMILMFARVF